jgi:nucleoside-diphosphate-sugar epimerase
VTWRASYRDRRVLVLGGNGFIGRWVARQLTDAGADLVLVVREPDPAARGWARLGVRGATLAGDLSRPGLIGEIVRSVRPSITFNLAGYGVDPLERDESLGTRINHALVAELGAACAAERDPAWPGQHLVHAGSAAEYGSADGDLSEDGPAQPVTWYGRTKLAGTEALAAAARPGLLRAVSGRLFTVYGPGEPAGRLLPSLIQAAGDGSAVRLTAGKQRRDFTYVEEAAEGLLRLGSLSQEGLGAVNLATGTLESVRGFAERAAAVLGLPRERLRFGVLPDRPLEMHHREVNVGRLRTHCRWVPAMSIEEGVRRTVESR